MAKTRTLKLEPFDVSAAEQVAAIIGPHSACANALEIMKRRRANGEDVHLYRDRKTNTIIVGPAL